MTVTIFTPECFEQVGGRCKLVEDTPTLLHSGHAAVELHAKKRDEAKSEHKQRHHLEKRQSQLRRFLKEHGFDSEDVNAPKVSVCGLMKSFPLHRAAKEERFDMLLLLLQFGADPLKKDSYGRTVYHYVKSKDFEQHMRLIHLKASVSGFDSL
mmetsp:Transcript_33751/g.54052  ORF Transcript_33751/g.54052 Transcript_33751/m.54052 type:complete len:153 (+) Transcript_33751:40-498(+)